jgi:hypothetical protein
VGSLAWTILERDVHFDTGMFVRPVMSFTAALSCMPPVAAPQQHSATDGHVVKPEQLNPGSSSASRVPAGTPLNVPSGADHEAMTGPVTARVKRVGTFQHMR